MNQKQNVQVENLKVVYMKNDIEIIEHDNCLWIGAEKIGNKLGYKKPRESINQIYQRYKKHFKERETKIVEFIETDKNGKKQKRTIRIFSVPNSAMRLCFLSRAKNCLEVHDEILENYEEHKYNSLINSKIDRPLFLTEWQMKEMKFRIGKNKANKFIAAMLNGEYDGTKRYLPYEDIARLDAGTARSEAIRREAKRKKVTPKVIYEAVRKTREELGLKVRNKRTDIGVKKHPEDYEAFLKCRRENPDWGYKRIYAAIKPTVTIETIRAWLNHARREENA
jgi:hypothetical protein